MEIKTFVLGPLQTNTFLLVEGNSALLIDPASKAEKLIDILADLDLKGIILTHGHFDHLKAVDGLYEHYHCPVYLNSKDEYLARDKYAGKDFGLVSYITCPTIDLKQGKLNIDNFDLEIMETPGHTMGSVIIVSKNAIFTGDTLFKQSVGRTDLEGGSISLLRESLRVFNTFNKDYIIYPGHDQESNLAYELANNPYLI